ncbi:ATP-binding protein [Mycobacterium sp. URHB0021]
MDRELNPFKPGSGLRPPALEGRARQVEDFDLLVARSKRRMYDRGMILTGLRGVGKTTLLNVLADRADRQGWLTITIEARANEAGTATVRARLAQELTIGLRRYSRVHRLHQLIDPLIELARGFSVGVGLGPANITFESRAAAAASGDISLDVEELVEAIATALKPRASTFGLFIDEMQDLDGDLLSALLAAQHRSSQREWPFFLIGAGLPNLPAVLAESRSYAERQFTYSTIGPLSDEAAADALQVPVQRFGGDFTPEALETIVAASGGYPYFLQEFGQAIWNVAAQTPFDTEDAQLAVEVGLARLDEGFFPSRWRRATDRERRYMTAMARTAEEQPRTGHVAQLMGSAATAVSDVRDSALKKGLIWAPEHGRIAFTVPHMADFIRRQAHEDA